MTGAMNIYLLGMIGSGKTTVGKIIAARLGWQFIDLDEDLDERAGMSFHKLVEERGWLEHRQLEYTICKHYSTLERSVIALGGGTVRYEWNRDVLQGTGYRILLVARLRHLADRVRDHDRPRVNDGTTLEQDLVSIWRAHRGLYYSFADKVYRTDLGKTPEEEAEELIEAWKNRSAATG